MTASRRVVVGSLRWVPPDMLRDGFGPWEIEVLLDLEREPRTGDRLLPPRAMCSVPLERVYDGLTERRLIETRRSSPVSVSLCDPLVLTPEGVAVLERWRVAVREMGTPRC